MNFRISVAIIVFTMLLSALIPVIGCGGGQTRPTTYTLTIDNVGSGTTSPSIGSYTYSAGTMVTITATPDEGWGFGGWSGDTSSTDVTIDVYMDQNRTVTAQFSTPYDMIYDQLKTQPLSATYILQPLGLHPHGWNLWDEMVPTKGGAIDLPDIKVTPSIALEVGEAVRIILQSNATMYYPGVSEAWLQDHDGIEAAKLHVLVVDCDGPDSAGKVYWDGSAQYGGKDIKYSYTANLDTHIELIIQNNGDQLKGYRLMVASNDSQSSHTVTYSITAK